MRVLRSLILLLVLLATVVLGGVWVYLDFATELALEEGGAQMLGVETEVGSVRVLPFNGSIRIEDIRIANPAGFSADPFLEVARGDVKIALASLATSRVEISSIELSGLVLRLEEKGGKANYEKLGESEPTPATEPDEGDSRRSVVVRLLTLRNVTAYVDGAVHGQGTGDLVLEIPEIVLRDVGSESDAGMMAAELSQVVIGAIVNALVKKGFSLPVSLMSDVGDIPVEVAGGVVRGFETVADEGGKLLGDVIGGTVDTAEKGVEQVAGALRSLFGSSGDDEEAGR